MKQTFAPARQDKISTLIIRQIRSAIMQGSYKPGDALPTESEMTSQFNVSKHTVREALRTLEGMGLVTIRRGAGGGPVVSSIDWEIARESFENFLFFQDISLRELSEVRSLLEPYIARKAAESFDAQAIAELQAVHEQCEELIRQGKSLVGAEAEVMFHVLLGKNSGNSALWVILDFVNSILMKTKQEVNVGQDFSLTVLEAHRKILKAIEDKDGDAAERHMRAHVNEVEQCLAALMQKGEVLKAV